MAEEKKEVVVNKGPLCEESPLINIKFKRKPSTTGSSYTSPALSTTPTRKSSGPLYTVESNLKQRAGVHLSYNTTSTTSTSTPTPVLSTPQRSSELQRSRSMGTLTMPRSKSEQKIGVLPPEAILNMESHHVRTKEEQKRRTQPIVDQYQEAEKQIKRSIEIDQRLRRIIDGCLMDAITKNMLRVPLISFMNSCRGVEFVTDYTKLAKKYDIIKVSHEKEISDNQFSLDLINHDHEYNSIVSILIYLSNHKPRLVYIISKHLIAFSLRPPDFFDFDDATAASTAKEEENKTPEGKMVLFQQEQSGHLQKQRNAAATATNGGNELTFIDKAVMHLFTTQESAFFYRIIVDLAQTYRDT